MIYQLIIRPDVKKSVLRIGQLDRSAILERIQNLATEPRPSIAKRLVGFPLWRLRVRDFRIVYSIDDENRAVRIVRVVRRNEATYRGL